LTENKYDIKTIVLKKIIDETLQYAPNDPKTLFYINIAKEKKSKIAREEEFAQKNPTPENYLNLSLIYYNDGLYERCIDICHEAIKLRPDFAEAYNNICAAYNSLGRYEEAIIACEKSLALNPNNELTKNNLNWAKQEKMK